MSDSNANDMDEVEEASSGGSLVKPPGKDEYQDLVDMTAMVDIVFFLLVFFMITSAVGVLSCIGMPPPKQEGAAASPKRPSDFDADTEAIIVRLDEQNRIFIDDVEYPSEADLKDRLRIARNAQAKKLLVKGHGNAQHGTLVTILDMGLDLGFENSLSVAKEDESK